MIIEAPVVRGLNHLLGQADWARAKLAPYASRQARFVMPPWQLDLAVTEDGLFEQPTDHEAECDVTVTLPADSPLLAINGIDRVMAAAHVTGNAEFATELSFVLRNLRWDAEEDLSRIFGDIIAHRITGAASAFAGWQKRSASNLAENLVEYLTEEARLLAPTSEFARFRQESDEIAGRIAALEARIKRLHQREIRG